MKRAEHQIKEHPIEERFVCLDCGSSSESLKSFQTHYVSKHLRNKYEVALVRRKADLNEASIVNETKYQDGIRAGDTSTPKNPIKSVQRLVPMPVIVKAEIIEIDDSDDEMEENNRKKIRQNGNFTPNSNSGVGSTRNETHAQPSLLSSSSLIPKQNLTCSICGNVNQSFQDFGLHFIRFHSDDNRTVVKMEKQT